MTDRTQSLSLNEINLEHDQSNTTKQILSDFTNIHPKNCQTSSVDNNTPIQVVRRRRPSTLATVRRYKETVKQKNQLNTIPIDIEILKDIQDFQQMAMYNARQTPLIPLIANVDLSSLVEPSQQQDDLLMDVLTLINNIDSECSFFEQFKI